ncbi:hypothetical protein L7F22_063535 [Adiantum nelumboides]|nr:hypothetical protein [Adiantum nelumboides]
MKYCGQFLLDTAGGTPAKAFSAKNCVSAREHNALEQRPIIEVNLLQIFDPTLGIVMASVSPPLELAQSPINGVTKPAPSSPIQSYMRKKNRLRSQAKKASIARAQAEMAARKEKLKVLELERNARLRIEASHGKEKEEGTLPRPHWDSSVSSSVGEINGPWSKSSYPVAPVDFPLPKPIEGDDLPSAGLAKSSCESFCASLERNGFFQEMSSIADCNLLECACMHAESPQAMINVGYSNHHVASSNKNVYQQEAKVFTRPKVCSNHSVKSRSYSPVQCFKDGTKGMRPLPLSKIPKTSKKQQHTEVSVGQPSSKTFPKYAPKYTLSQQAYDTESSAPLLYRDDGAGQNTFSTNKRKLSTYSLTSQNLKFVERQLKMHAQANGLHYIANIPTAVHNSYNTVDLANESMPCHCQYLTYHLERFPSKYKMEAWTEKKRVALLKVLAQQLVIRLNAAESHPSYLLDGNVRAHALSLRKNLEKFQEELHGAVQTLEAFYSQPSRIKSSGYIVLPSKLERKRNFHFDKSLARGSHIAGLHLQEEAFSNQDLISNQDLSSEKANSATSIMTESPILEEREKYRQQKVRNGDPFKDNILSSGEENTQVTLEAKAPDIMFQGAAFTIANNNTDVFKMFAAEDRLDGINYPMWAYMMQHVHVSKGIWNIVKCIDVRPGSEDVGEVEDVVGLATRIAAVRVVCLQLSKLIEM